MRAAWFALFLAACGSDEHLLDGPVGSTIDALAADAGDAAGPPSDADGSLHVTVTLAGTSRGAVRFQILAADDIPEPCLGPVCQYAFNPGDTVRLRAVAASTFNSWSGGCGGTATQCTFVGTTDVAVTATFDPDPHEVVTFLRPIPVTPEPLEAFDAAGNRYVLDGSSLTAYDPGGAELWTSPLAGGAVDIHTCAGTVSDFAGGTWVLGLSPDGETCGAQHFDAGNNLIDEDASVGYYDGTIIGDPLTGVPIVASTGHSHWQLCRPNAPCMLNEDAPDDFPADIKHGAAFDSTGAINAIRGLIYEYQELGISRVRMSSTGVLLDSVIHTAHDYEGLSAEQVLTGDDGLVVYRGELWVEHEGFGAFHYEWAQVLDYVP